MGTWDARWEGGHGTNTVTREYGGHAIIERFESLEPEPFRGFSLSVFTAAEGWRQSWVDSQGSNWWFTGGPTDEGFEFVTIEGNGEATVRKRMVFLHVREDSFDWRWERSDDRGATWTSLWEIAFRRRPAA